MPIPSIGYAYEKDAAADGVLHYFPMFDLFTPGVVVDTIGGFRAEILNDSQGVVKTQSGIIGHGLDLTANGGAGNHSVLASVYDPANAKSFSDWTVCLWVRFKSYSAITKPYILNFAEAQGFRIYFNAVSGASTIFAEFSNTAIGTLSTPYTPTVGANHLIIVSSNSASNTVSVYVDDVALLSSSLGYQNLFPYMDRLIVGDLSTSPTSDNYADAVVDELCIFDRALDVTDRSTLWNAGAGIQLVQYANNHREFPVEIVGRRDQAFISFDALASSIVGTDTDVGTDSILRALGDSLDQVGGNDSITASLLSFEALADGSAFSSLSVGNTSLSYYVNDGYAFISGFNVDGEAYIGVVVNTESSSVTEYENLAINSAAVVGDKFIASDGSGLLEFGNDTDDGNPISAYITTKLFSFRKGTKKRVERAYLGVRNGTPLVLKVITRDDAGAKKEYWYEIEDTSNTLRETRVKLGKGIKANYYQFTLQNNFGGSFELDSIEFKPIILRRRV